MPSKKALDTCKSPVGAEARAKRPARSSYNSDLLIGTVRDGRAPMLPDYDIVSSEWITAVYAAFPSMKMSWPQFENSENDMKTPSLIKRHTDFGRKL